MNKDFLYNLTIFIGICILIYFIFRNIGVKEGLVDKGYYAENEVSIAVP